jgi:hypothetical protein
MPTRWRVAPSDSLLLSADRAGSARLNSERLARPSNVSDTLGPDSAHCRQQMEILVERDRMVPQPHAGRVVKTALAIAAGTPQMPDSPTPLAFMGDFVGSGRRLATAVSRSHRHERGLTAGQPVQLAEVLAKNVDTASAGPARDALSAHVLGLVVKHACSPTANGSFAPAPPWICAAFNGLG